MRLPPSLDRTVHTIEREVAYVRDLTMAQRLQLIDALCESALRLLQDHPQRERLQRVRAPLPESTRRALDRLRQQHRSPAT